jgi:hypothetical protein
VSISAPLWWTAYGGCTADMLTSLVRDGYREADARLRTLKLGHVHGLISA